MTIDQAVAILEAERVLQIVGAEGPDSVSGAAWNDYIQEAGAVIQTNKFWCNAFDDLHVLKGVTDSTDPIEGPDCPGCVNQDLCDDCEYPVSQKDYVPFVCPWCKHDRPSYSGKQQKTDANTIWIEVICFKCGKVWEEKHTLAGYREVTN